MPQAISYIRFSSFHQGRGSSTERQQQLVDEWLRNNPEYTLSNLSQKDLGVSAYKGKHLDSGLGSILAAIKNQSINPGDVLLVEAFDRLGRLPANEMHPLIWDIVNKGVTIITLEDNQTYSKASLNKDSSKLYILVGKVQQAHDYSDRLSKRLKASYESRRMKAKAGEAIKAPRPLWLGDKEKEDKLKQAIDLYLEGYGYRSIVVKLDLPINFHHTLKRQFRSPALIGRWENPAGGEPIDNVFPALISTDKYWQLQRAMNERSMRPGPSGTYELTALVKCSECGSSFHFQRKNYKTRTIITAICANHLRKHCTNNKSWPYHVLLHLYENTYNSYLEAPAMARFKSVIGTNLLALETQLEQLKIKQAKAHSMALEDPEDDFAATRYRGIKDQVKTLEDAIQEAEAISSGTSEPTEEEFEYYFALVDQIRDNPLLLNQELQNQGYRITATKDSVTCEDITYTLVRRSQKHACYIVHSSAHGYLGINHKCDYWEAETLEALEQEMVNHPEPPHGFYLGITVDGDLV